MRLENAVAADVLERILSAYGFTMQKELSDKLGIAKSNVASWLQRGQVPGNVLVQCALDTGVNVEWLVKGEFANANNLQSLPSSHSTELSGQLLIQKMLSSGGKAVLRRVMQAYGFTTQKQLSEYLGISTGTISTWIRREYFPGDLVITCALDTGISLEWLATGNICPALVSSDTKYLNNSFYVPSYFLLAGKMERQSSVTIDRAFLSVSYNEESLFLLRVGEIFFLVDSSVNEISNGCWLLDIDGLLDVYEVSRRPNNTLSVKGGGGEFECAISQVKSRGVVILKIEITA